MAKEDTTSVNMLKSTKDKLVRLQAYGAFKNGVKFNLGAVINNLVDEKLNRIK